MLDIHDFFNKSFIGTGFYTKAAADAIEFLLKNSESPIILNGISQSFLGEKGFAGTWTVQGLDGEVKIAKNSMPSIFSNILDKAIVSDVMEVIKAGPSRKAYRIDFKVPDKIFYDAIAISRNVAGTADKQQKKRLQELVGKPISDQFKLSALELLYKELIEKYYEIGGFPMSTEDNKAFMAIRKQIDDIFA